MIAPTPIKGWGLFSFVRERSELTSTDVAS